MEKKKRMLFSKRITFSKDLILLLEKSHSIQSKIIYSAMLSCKMKSQIMKTMTKLWLFQTQAKIILTYKNRNKTINQMAQLKSKQNTKILERRSNNIQIRLIYKNLPLGNKTNHSKSHLKSALVQLFHRLLLIELLYCKRLLKGTLNLISLEKNKKKKMKLELVEVKIKKQRENQLTMEIIYLVTHLHIHYNSSKMIRII